jgi:hypothetical protein
VSAVSPDGPFPLRTMIVCLFAAIFALLVGAFCYWVYVPLPAAVVAGVLSMPPAILLFHRLIGRE